MADLRIKQMYYQADEPSNAASGDWWATSESISTFQILFDIMYPVGCYFMGDTPPTLGTWSEVTTDGRALWIGDGASASGTTISQSLPKPTLTCGNQSTSHTHTRGSMEIQGNMDLYCDGWTGGGAFDWGTRSGTHHHVAFDSTGTYNTEFKASRNWTGSTSTQSASHNHSVTVDTAGAYGTGTKVQPDAYVVKLWHRTA